jgi:hypothetical protein
MKIYSSALVCQPPFAIGKFAHRAENRERVFPYPFEVKSTPMCDDARLDEEEFLVYCTGKNCSRQRAQLAAVLQDMGMDIDVETMRGCLIGSVKFRRVEFELWRTRFPHLAAVSEAGAEYIYEVCYARLLKRPVHIPNKRAHVGIRWASLSDRVCRNVRKTGFRKKIHYVSELN